jgi:large subunit ribosomal protein L25
MSEPVLLKVTSREKSGSRYSRQLRRTGCIPLILYQKGKLGLPLSAKVRDFEKVILQQKENRLINLELENGKQKPQLVVIKDIQRDSLRQSIVHVDLQSITGLSQVKIKLPVKLVGEPIGVKVESGVLQQLLFALEVKAAPESLPTSITLDVSELHKGSCLRIADLPPQDYTVMNRPDEIIGTVTGTRAAISETTAEEEAEGEAAEAPAEGEEEKKAEKEGEKKPEKEDEKKAEKEGEKESGKKAEKDRGKKK